MHTVCIRQKQRGSVYTHTHTHTHNADGCVGFSLQVSGNRDLLQGEELSINNEEQRQKGESDFCIMLRVEIQFSKDMFLFYFVPRGAG